MNIIINTQSFNTHNAYWLDTKPNIIMDGNFTKINYINEIFTMNGIFLTFPIQVSSIDIIDNKKQMKFNTANYANASLIKEFVRIEHRLLDNYMQTKQINHKKNYLLAKQLYSGIMKIYKENIQNETNMRTIQYVIKISGIWETTNECGLTYKLFEAYN
tara:strand:+ start:296 stop:772 length:477 start_codon:yes stop_codon:yes gene_type:complete